MPGDDESLLRKFENAAQRHSFDGLAYISQKGKLDDSDISDVYYQNLTANRNQVARRVC